jgi:hypothetical protein
MNEIRKAHRLSSWHAFADAFTDQPEECLRFLTMRDQRRPGEGLQCIARDGWWGGAPNISGAVRALSSNIVCVAFGNRSNPPGSS